MNGGFARAGSLCAYVCERAASEAMPVNARRLLPLITARQINATHPSAAAAVRGEGRVLLSDGHRQMPDHLRTSNNTYTADQ